MLDIRFVRENPEAVKENIRKKFQDAKLPLVDEVIKLDAEYRAAIGEASDLRANRNKLSKQIGALMGQAKKDPSKAAEAEEIKKQVTAQADRLKELEAKETELQAKIQEIMYTIPQMIDPSVPIGPDDSCNVEVQRFGEPVVPDYPIPDHVDIMRVLKVSIWMPPAAYPATAATTCWATSPACTKLCWPTPATS